MACPWFRLHDLALDVNVMKVPMHTKSEVSRWRLFLWSLPLPGSHSGDPVLSLVLVAMIHESWSVEPYRAGSDSWLASTNSMATRPPRTLPLRVDYLNWQNCWSVAWRTGVLGLDYEGQTIQTAFYRFFNCCSILGTLKMQESAMIDESAGCGTTFCKTSQW